MTKKRGFFAYSSQPKFAGEVIEEAIQEINSGGVTEIISWKNINPSGSIIIDRVLEAIDSSDFVCADLTGMSDNVLFEIGYSIAKRKPIWLILDTSHTHSYRKFNELSFLTIVGYRNFSNTRAIVESFYEDEPYQNTEKIVDQLLKTVGEQSKTNAILFLKSQVETNYSQYIVKQADDLKLPLIIDDPSENKVQSLNWYVENLIKSTAILAQFSSIERSGFELQNEKCAFVSGLAHGLGIRLLMVAEEPYEVPIDYRGLLKKYSNKVSCISAVRPFLEYLKEEIVALVFKKNTALHREQEKSALLKINFGEYIAEHESEKIYNYFIETSHIQSLIKNENNIVIGRKGSGKTATLYYLLDLLRQEKRNIISLIKPINFEVDGLIELMGKYSSEFEKGYLVEALWKFIIYSEIAATLYQIIKDKEKNILSLSSDELEFLSFIERNPSLFLSDFSTRIEEQLQELNKIGFQETQSDFKTRISEALHTNILKELRIHFSRIIERNRRIIILIDNLDKSWRKNDKLNHVSRFLLGLLGVTGRIVKDLTEITNSKVTFQLTLFLRSDIFKYVLKNAREPDKIEHTRMRWNDSEIFFRIIEERFVQLNDDEVSHEDLWNKYITKEVNGVDVKKFITENVFPRPRDIIYFFKSAKDIAVSRGHSRIEENDLKSALSEYSNWVFKSVIVENGITINQMEEFMYHLFGESAILTFEDIKRFMELAGIDVTGEGKINSFIDHLVSLTILGREIGQNVYDFEYDFDGAPKLKALAGKLNSNRYRIHNALIPYLECKIPSDLSAIAVE